MELTAAEPSRASAEPTTTALARITSLAKAFGPTQALSDGSLELHPGEVHALVGENGSGKSTLVKILSGVHSPDAGELELYGAPAEFPTSPGAAQQDGVVTVFQEVLVAEARSVLDNIWLGADGLLRTAVPTGEKRERATAILERLLDDPLDLDTPVEELSLSDRQACCIARALMRDPRILILDEATSALDVATRDRLFEIVGELSDEGVGVIFITHRMDEVSELGDRVTVLRSGETVGQLRRGEWTPEALVRLMTGAENLTEGVRDRVDLDLRQASDAPVLKASGLRLAPGFEPFDFEVRPGELVGVAGLEGHGQDEFVEALRGGGAVTGTVIRHRDGKDVVVRRREPRPETGSPTCLASAAMPCSGGCRFARTSGCRRCARTATRAGSACDRRAGGSTST